MRQRTNLLSEEELAALRADVDALLAGPLALEATYLRFEEGAFDPETGVAGDAYAPVSVKVLAVGGGDRAEEGGRYDETARAFLWLLAASQIPWPPELRDRLEALGAVWEIVAVGFDPLRSHWALTARMA